MAGTVITVAQQKGGAGKTTLVVQLAVALAKAGKKVAAVDIDPQGSLSAWLDMRQQIYGDGLTPNLSGLSGSAWRLSSDLRRLRENHDLILLDSPPHIETESKFALRAADLVLIPIQPSLLDLWATKPTIDLARKEGRQVLLVLNRVPPRGRLPAEVRQAILIGGLPLADAQFGNRQSFAASIGLGKGVCESEPKGTAADEVHRLSEEITRFLDRKPS